jgi:hypothetical protein
MSRISAIIRNLDLNDHIVILWKYATAKWEPEQILTGQWTHMNLCYT